MGAAHKGQVLLQYTGKIKPDDGKEQTSLSWFMQARINELCDRQYGFMIDSRTDVDAVDVGGIMRFANHAGTVTKSGVGGMNNCYCKIVFEPKNLSHCCYLIAVRDIEEREELLFDYCYEHKFEWLE